MLFREFLNTFDENSNMRKIWINQDLAEIYGYEVKRLNEQVKRNISRFPGDFMFQLNKEELPEKSSTIFWINLIKYSISSVISEHKRF